MERNDTPIGYRVAKAALSAPLHRAFELEVEGSERIPDGPVILAANHRSFMDSVFLALVVDRPVSFLAKAEYFDRRRTAWLFRALGQIPLRRGSPAGARRAMSEAQDVLAAGGAVGVYPEGTRSRSGRLQRGKIGPARLAAASGAPLVPIGLVGTDEVQPPDQLVPQLGKAVTVRVGRPIHARFGAAGDREHLRSVTDALMTEIADLCGERYTYA